MSGNKPKKSHWNSVKLRIPFLGLRRRTTKVTSTDQKPDSYGLNGEETAAVQNESNTDNTKPLQSDSDGIVANEERDSLNGSDSNENVNTEDGSSKDGNVEEEKNELGELDPGDTDNKNDHMKNGQNEDGRKHQREGQTAKSNANIGMNEALGSLPEDEEYQRKVSSNTEGRGASMHHKTLDVDGRESSTDANQKQRSFAEVGKGVRHRIITVNSFASHGRPESGEVSKRPQEENENLGTVQGNEKAKLLGNPLRRSSLTSQQNRVEKMRKERQNKPGQEKQWRNVKTVYNVAFKHGTHESEYETAISAAFDEREKKRQAEMLFWRLDMEDIMLRLRRINKTLDAHLRRLSDVKKSGQ